MGGSVTPSVAFQQMMHRRKDGGPAFPRENYQTNDFMGQAGMSIRDYFAAKALAGWMASYGPEGHHPAALAGEGSDDEREASAFLRCVHLAEMSYVMADAMLTVRGRAR